MSKKTELAVVRAAMYSYRLRLQRYPVDYAIIISGDDYGMGKDSANLVRACAIHAKSEKAKGKKPMEKATLQLSYLLQILRTTQKPGQSK